tara:strand:- start:3779 stop:4147 length:369 start_codon:yes stop_codon:yes gene_type:complete
MRKKENKDIKENYNEDQDFRVLKYIDNTQKTSQRELSQSLNISLGKINYILNALIEKGIVKARNFKNNKNKRAYAYYLTPKGIQEKARLTIGFFNRKSEEYNQLKKELDDLKEDIENLNNEK